MLSCIQPSTTMYIVAEMLSDIQASMNLYTGAEMLSYILASLTLYIKAKMLLIYSGRNGFIHTGFHDFVYRGKDAFIYAGFNDFKRKHCQRHNGPRWRHLHKLQIWPPDGTTCISCKFGHQLVLLALVANLATRWSH